MANLFKGGEILKINQVKFVGGLFNCGEGILIDSSKVCNQVRDCPDGIDEKHCGDCNFKDHDLCDYTRDEIPADSNEFGWRFTDQSNDNSDDDYYHYSMTASGSSPSLDKHAKLSSPKIETTYINCYVEFDYLYNTTTSSLLNDRFSLMLKFQYGRSINLWKTSLQPLQQNVWHHLLIWLSRIHHGFNLTFDAMPFGSSNGLHSLRDIQFLSCKPQRSLEPDETCEKFLCKNRVCIDIMMRCDFEDDCGDGSDEQNCEFSHMTDFQSNDGLGLWGELYPTSWTLMSADQQNDLRVAPTFDHTTRFEPGGKYLFSNKSEGSIIDGPAMRINPNCRFSMFVMKNSANSTLWIKLLDIETSEQIPLTHLTDFHPYFQRFYWMAGDRKLYNSTYKILIESELQRTSDNFIDPYIAIDDLSFSSECIILNHDHPNVTTMSPNNTCLGILCLNEHHVQICVPEIQLCDFIRQCADGSDEKNCGDCDFNNGDMCQWKNDDGGSLAIGRWHVYQPAFSSPEPLPYEDGDRDRNGGYLGAKLDSWLIEKYAKLESSKINGRTTEWCKMRLQYSSNHRTSFRVFAGEDLVVDVGIISTSEYWKSLEVDIGAHDPGFKYVIEVRTEESIPNSVIGYIAFDNIHLDNCTVPNHDDNNNHTQEIEKLNCDFETDICGWNIGDNQTRTNWFRTNDKHLEPGIDHTSQIIPMPEKHGFWISTQTNDDDSDTTTTNIFKTDIPIHATANNQGYCMRFWYYYFGVERATFFVTVFGAEEKNTRSQILWLRTQPITRDWQEAWINIPEQSGNFHLMFTATVSENTIVGLDDLWFATGPCQEKNPNFCDFELNLCDWKPLTGTMQRMQNGITVDHTTGTAMGHFLEQQLMEKEYYAAVTKLITHENRQPSCLNLYYYFSVDDTKIDDSMIDGQISLQLYENEEWETLKNISMQDVVGMNQQNVWTALTVSFYAGKEALIKLQIKQNQQLILIDDIRYMEHYCDSIHGNCDFETDMCGWYNSDPDGKNSNNLNSLKSFLWIRVTPRNDFVRQNGIEYDHTLKTDRGYYLALPLDMHRVMFSTTVILHSMIINKLEPEQQEQENVVCFQMFYFALSEKTYNATTVMTVQLIDPKNKGQIIKQQPVPALEIDKSKGEKIKWIQFQMEVNENLPSIYAFILKTEYNPNIISDIGIDDITVKHERCSNDGSTPQPVSTTPIPDSEKIADCDFEQDSQQCQWTFQQDIWSIVKFKSQGDPYAPLHDHTTESMNGHYLLYKNDTNSNQPEEQWIISPSMPYDRHRCLSFWYYADGGAPFDVCQIDIWLSITDANNNTSFSSSETLKHLNEYRFLRTETWRLIRLNIPYSSNSNNKENMQIKIKYKTMQEKSQKLDYSSFALDDISIHPEHCEHQLGYVYTFTDGFEDLLMEQTQPFGPYNGHIVNYKNVSNDDDESQEQKYPIEIIPKKDHTTFSIDYGYYFLFLNLNSEQQNTTFVDSLSMVEIKPDFEPSCVRFAYMSEGNVTFKVYATDQQYDENNEQNQVPIWFMVAEKPWWTIVEITKQFDYKHRIVFEMTKSLDHSSYLALDDLTILKRECQNPMDCDFNHDQYCSYSYFQDQQTNQAFRIYKSWMSQIDGANNYPGPDYDHSGIMDNGYLMLSNWREAQNIDSDMQTAKIISGSMHLFERIFQHYCLTWWLWINDPKSTIKIYLIRFRQRKYVNTEALATIYNTRHLKWTEVSVTLNQSLLGGYDEFQLLIEGEIDNNLNSFVAIDDIELSRGECPKPFFKCLNDKLISSDQICDFRKDCPSGLDEVGCGDRCNFEQTDLCGWKDTGRRDLDHWNQVSVEKFLEEDSKHAPKFDADGDKSGHYMLVRRWSQEHSETGHAEMALNYENREYYFKHSWHTCMMHFDYFIDASNSFYLKTRFGDEINNLNTFFILANRKPSTDGGWVHARTHIGLRWSSFLVEFDAFDSNIDSIIAIDNVVFEDCEIPEPLPHNKNCSSHRQILCNETRICIDESDICDGINDCGENAEDESWRICGYEKWRRCSFETWSSCEMELENDDDSATYWTIVTGQQFEDDTKIPGYEPLIDNTKRTSTSPYALLQTKENFHEDHQYSSKIFTPVLQTSNLNATNPCQLRFFYNWHTDLDVIKDTDLSLEVYVQYLELSENNENEKDKHDDEKLDILWQMDGTEVLVQQRWSKAVINFPDFDDDDWNHKQEHRPFRFVLRAWIKVDHRSRLALDDLSYGSNCIKYEFNTPSPPPTPSSPTDNPPTGNPTIVPPNPPIHSSHSTTGVVVMIITLLLVTAIIGSIILHRKYFYTQQISAMDTIRRILGSVTTTSRTTGTDLDNENLVVSMKHLETTTTKSTA